MFASAPPNDEWIQKQKSRNSERLGEKDGGNSSSFQTADLAGQEGLPTSSGKPFHLGQQQVDSSSEFSTVRYRLDQLDYKEWMDPVSVPLVKRLLSDLINTTQVAREWKHLGYAVLYLDIFLI